ncbi:uncharacterized protein PHALS_06563 [Plasmopara halstedii]|uniref:Uncharacterized protein n=1 Tax=Plasmopara halstedii TaxID=4781 RepID=A0A0P1B4A0_PLAHL|nr:uncharacterized protein PHALS_06563 [Plasmopara halstedii]CEG48758.1 hypothetical protein PHALS_06563 [Plasmopara halstedii]|eukprot:XP_024585127.1 hypothetical protein PHALS_06563 [Plasmopara halstedii]
MNFAVENATWASMDSKHLAGQETLAQILRLPSAILRTPNLVSSSPALNVAHTQASSDAGLPTQCC